MARKNFVVPGIPGDPVKFATEFANATTAMMTAVAADCRGKQNEAMNPRRRETTPDESTYRGRLAAAIHARREAIDMPVAELAEKVGVTTQTVYEWERGASAIDWNRLPALAKALRTTPRRLIPAE